MELLLGIVVREEAPEEVLPKALGMRFRVRLGWRKQSLILAGVVEEQEETPPYTMEDPVLVRVVIPQAQQVGPIQVVKRVEGEARIPSGV